MTGLTRLTCVQTRRRLDDYLDRELPPEELRLVRDHLETCVGCASGFTTRARAVQRIRGLLRGVTMPVALRARIAAMLDDEQRQI